MKGGHKGSHIGRWSPKAGCHGHRRSSGSEPSSPLSSLPSLRATSGIEIASTAPTASSRGGNERRSSRSSRNKHARSYGSDTTAPTVTCSRHSRSPSPEQRLLHAEADSSRILVSLADALRDARPGKRSSLLQKLAETYFHKHYLPEAVENCQETLSSALLASITTATNSHRDEAVLSCRILGAVLLTAGKDSVPRGLYDHLCDKLRGTVRSHPAAQVRGAAAELCGLLAFVGCGDDTKVQEALEFFFQRTADINFSATTEKGMSDEAETGRGLLSGLSLLATLLRPTDLGNFDSEPGASLWSFGERCLQQNDCAVRSTAGSMLALLFEAKWKSDPDTTVEELEARQGGLLGSLRKLCSTSGDRELNKSLSKNDKREQLGIARKVLSTAESGNCPDESICVGNRSIRMTFESWIGIVRYEAFKWFLAGAVAAHVQENETVFSALLMSASLSHQGNSSESQRTAESTRQARERHRTWLRDQKYATLHSKF